MGRKCGRERYRERGERKEEGHRKRERWSGREMERENMLLNGTP